MLNNLLGKLGYKETTPISYIIKHEKIKINSDHDFYGKTFENVYQSLFLHQIRLKNLIRDEEQSELENLFLKGFNYSVAKVDPTIGEVWESILRNTRNKTFLDNLTQQIALSTENKEIASEIVKKINSLFSQIAYGTILPEYVSSIELTVRIVRKNKEYFEHAYKNKVLGKEFFNEIKMIEALNLLDYDPTTTFLEFEKKENKIENLKNEFLNIKTPDLKRTIEDRITYINDKFKSEKSILHPGKEINLYQEGNLMAIRGRNPTLIEILKENSMYIFYDPWLSYGVDKNHFGDDVLTNSRNLLVMLLEGFALSYHLKFLENYKDKLSEKINNRPKENSDDRFQIVIRWKGQKNQLYDVLRQLKDKTLIGNSYEDLAAFLKQNVDLFKNTSLSTIQKELGKDKRPPKNKRIDIDL